MDLVLLLASAALGAAGWLVTNLWMAPIIEYLRAKKEVAAAVVTYIHTFVNANAWNPAEAKTLNEYRAKIRADAGALAASASQLPRWYSWLLVRKRESPEEAVQLMMLLAAQPNDLGSQSKELLGFQQALQLLRVHRRR